MLITESRIIICEFCSTRYTAHIRKERDQLNNQNHQKKQRKVLSVNRELCDWLSTKDLLEYKTIKSESLTSLKGLCAKHSQPKPSTARPGKDIPGTAHGCLFRDHRNIHGYFLLAKRQFGPSGENVFGVRIKVATADDCAKACSLEEQCDAFAFSSFQSNPTKDCVLVLSLIHI